VTWAAGPKLYQIMQKQLKAAMGWDVVPREKIVAAAKVRGIAQGKAGKAMAALDYKNKKILIPGIAGTAMAAALIKKHGRALARELDADALMTLSFTISDESGSKTVSEMLFGAMRRNAAQVHLLQCNLSLTLQNPRDASKIWHEPGSPAGAPIRQLQNTTPFPSEI
jgi:hypothetical protein